MGRAPLRKGAYKRDPWALLTHSTLTPPGGRTRTSNRRTTRANQGPEQGTIPKETTGTSTIGTVKGRASAGIAAPVAGLWRQPPANSSRRPRWAQDPKYPSAVIPREHLSSYTPDYDDYKTDLLNGLKLARDCISESSARNRAQMKTYYDKRWKTAESTVFKIGDRVYLKTPTEKARTGHPKLIHDWRGLYRVIEASENSALITMIGDNEQPVRVQFDHLIKVPPSIDDTPITGKTRRGRRGRPSKINRSVPTIQLAQMKPNPWDQRSAQAAAALVAQAFYEALGYNWNRHPRRDPTSWRNTTTPDQGPPVVGPPVVASAEDQRDSVSSCSQLIGATVAACDSALTAQLRNLSQTKRQNILLEVSNAADAAIAALQEAWSDQSGLSSVLHRRVYPFNNYVRVYLSLCAMRLDLT
ncbi:hypothetical protein Q1695_000608 [Nippostrongylus brasiliensis]|nr:hypothetical protein Q1695_000608 [Nippostrongylus brasiliensis]